MSLPELLDAFKWETLVLAAFILFCIDFYGHQDKKHHEHAMNLASSVKWSIFWVGSGLLFGIFVLFAEGNLAASQYYASFILEKGMSVDNIAVWLAILTGMQIPKDDWHRLLTWGIIGAIIFRGIFIFGGLNLMHRFEFLTVILGFFLLWGAVKIVGLKFDLKKKKVYFSGEDAHFDPDKDKMVSIARWILKKVNPNLKTAQAIFIVALLTIELTDIVFALDSVPVVVALNTSSFVAASSNLFAVFGLRALFFVVSDFLSKLEYLKYGLGAVLLFIAAKMIFEFHIEPLASLVVITVILTTATILSLLHKSKSEIN
jgi:tellurite resistance protein TerC